jgi:hypothetical protein
LALTRQAFSGKNPEKMSTLRLPSPKAEAYSGLTLRGALCPTLKGEDFGVSSVERLAPSNGSICSEVLSVAHNERIFSVKLYFPLPSPIPSPKLFYEIVSSWANVSAAYRMAAWISSRVSFG